MSIHIQTTGEHGDDFIANVSYRPRAEDSLCVLLRPMITSMSVLGLFSENRNKRHWYEKILNFKNYSALVLVVIWINALRYIPIIVHNEWRSNSSTLVIIAAFSWSLMCMFNATISFYGCRKHIPYFRHCWDILHSSKSYSCFREVFNKKNLRRRVRICVMLAWIYIAGNYIFCLVLAFGPDEETVKVYEFMTRLPALSTAGQVVGVSLSLIAVGAWVFPLVFQISLSMFLMCDFQVIEEVLKATLNKKKREFPQALETLRNFHSDICHMVNCLDNVMSLWIMSAYVTNLPMACVFLYSLVTEKMESTRFAMQITWLLTNVVYLCGVTVAAALVNAKAHSPLIHLYDIRIADATPSQIAQLNLFLSRLTGSTIGFTALGMVTITKEAMLTLAGLYLTYFVLLIQFNA